MSWIAKKNTKRNQKKNEKRKQKKITKKINDEKAPILFLQILSIDVICEILLNLLLNNDIIGAITMLDSFPHFKKLMHKIKKSNFEKYEWILYCINERLRQLRNMEYCDKCDYYCEHHYMKFSSLNEYQYSYEIMQKQLIFHRQKCNAISFSDYMDKFPIFRLIEIFPNAIYYLKQQYMTTDLLEKLFDKNPSYLSMLINVTISVVGPTDVADFLKKNEKFTSAVIEKNFAKIDVRIIAESFLSFEAQKELYQKYFDKFPLDFHLIPGQFQTKEMFRRMYDTWKQTTLNEYEKYSILVDNINSFTPMKLDCDWKKCIKYGACISKAPATQELCEIYVNRNFGIMKNDHFSKFSLGKIPIEFRTKNICKISLDFSVKNFEFIPGNFKTKEFCSWFIKKYGCIHANYIPDEFKTFEFIKCLDIDSYNVRSFINVCCDSEKDKIRMYYIRENCENYITLFKDYSKNYCIDFVNEIIEKIENLPYNLYKNYIAVTDKDLHCLFKIEYVQTYHGENSYQNDDAYYMYYNHPDDYSDDEY